MAPSYATPHIQRIWNEVYERWPAARSWGIQNCRKIADSKTWSQHSWANAWDITSPYPVKTTANLNHIRFLDEIYRYLVVNRERLNIRYILWRCARHWDHIHLDCWPYGLGLPPCAGGTLRVRNKDGSVGTSFKNEDFIVDTYTWQQMLNIAGYKGEDGEELKEDGVWGKNTMFATQAMMNDAVKGRKAHLTSAKNFLRIRGIRDKLSAMKEALS